jgi:hypothetical protein
MFLSVVNNFQYGIWLMTGIEHLKFFWAQQSKYCIVHVFIYIYIWFDYNFAIFMQP